MDNEDTPCFTQVVEENTCYALSQSAPQSSFAGSDHNNNEEDSTWGVLLWKNTNREEFRLKYRPKIPSTDNVFQSHSYSIGRSRTCDLHIDHKCISSKHCFIYCDYSQARMRVFMEDNSVNGTFINGALTKLSKGERMELRSGDEIFLINPRTLSATPEISSSSNISTNSSSLACFTFVNIRDRLAANREISVAPVASSNGVFSAFSHHQRRIEDDYVIGDKIGSGMSGQVYFCVNRLTKQRCAVKEIDTRKVSLTPGMSVEDMKNEATLMQQLKHPNIIKVLDTFQSPNALYIVMELVEGGDLFDRIVERGRYSEDNARKVMRNVLSAVQYLHSKNIIHRDLKPENILLVNPREDTEIKVTDFGLAKKASQEGLRTFCGTPQYFAPEVLRRKSSVAGLGRYGTSADMWSLGVILYIMLSGTFPFDEVDLFAQIENALYNFSGPEWNAVSHSAKNFIGALLNIQIDRRLTVDQALEHPWILNTDLKSSQLHSPSPSLSQQLFWTSPHVNSIPKPLTSSAKKTTSSVSKPVAQKSLKFYQQLSSQASPLTFTAKQSPLLPYQQHHQQQRKQSVHNSPCPRSSELTAMSTPLSQHVSLHAHTATPLNIYSIADSQHSTSTGKVKKSNETECPATVDNKKEAIDVNWLIPSAYIAVERELSGDEIAAYSDSDHDNDNFESPQNKKTNGSTAKSVKRKRLRSVTTDFDKPASLSPDSKVEKAETKKVLFSNVSTDSTTPTIKNIPENVSIKAQDVNCELSSSHHSENSEIVDINKHKSAKTSSLPTSVRTAKRQQSLLDLWSVPKESKLRRTSSSSSIVDAPQETSEVDGEAIASENNGNDVNNRLLRKPMKSLIAFFKNAQKQSINQGNKS